MLWNVGHQDAEYQEASKADGEGIRRGQSFAVLREVGHGCMGVDVVNAMRRGTYAGGGRGGGGVGVVQVEGDVRWECLSRVTWSD